MTKKEIEERKLYLSTLKTQLSLDDNNAVMAEMSARAKHAEAILKALACANINRDNIPGIDLYYKIDKNPVIKKYLADLFFFDTIKLKSSDTDQFLVAKANLSTFAKGEGLNPKKDETYQMMKSEFDKVIEHIQNCITYFQIENIKVIEEYDKPISKVWIKLLPSESYLDYLKKIKFISHGKFFTKKKK